MVEKTKESIASYYDSISLGYDELHGEEQYAKMKVIQSYLNSLPNNSDMKITQKSILLDVGCGSGFSSNYPCTVIGIDPSEKLIELARKRYADRENYSFFVCGGEDIDKLFENEIIFYAKTNKKRFDYITCISAIHHISNLEHFCKVCTSLTANIIFSVLPIPKKDEIIKTIQKHFYVEHTVIEKDVILFCKTKNN